MCYNLLKNSGVASHFLKGDLEPFCVMLGVQSDVFFQVGDGHVFPRGDLFGVDARNVVALANPHVVEFVFGEALPDGCFIYKGVDLVHFTMHTHFFPKAARGGFLQCLTVTRMAAAGVGPEARGVVLGQSPLLHE